MVIKFSEKFSKLINTKTLRDFLTTANDYDKAIKSCKESLPVSENGFIAEYCKEQDENEIDKEI